MEKQIFSVNQVKCKGIAFDRDGNSIICMENPVDALITSFSDNTREVCCLYADNQESGETLCTANSILDEISTCVFSTKGVK